MVDIARPTRARTPLAAVRLMAASIIAGEESRPATYHPCSASGAALRAAPQPMSSARRPPRARSLLAYCRSVSFGGDCAKPAAISGDVHGEGDMTFHYYGLWRGPWRF